MNLPRDVSELQTMVLALQKEKDEVCRRESQYETENKLLREQVRLLKLKLFAGKSERLVVDGDNDQGFLFDDVEVTIQPDESEDKESQQIEVKSHIRKKRGRKPLPADLPREEVVHDLSEEKKMCGCGSKMVRIGEESWEKLEMIPARLFVKRHIRPKYACRSCEGVDGKPGEGAVKIAPVPAQLIEKSYCSGSLLAHIAVSKFADSIPFYRQEQQFRRYGIELCRASMCNWILHVYRKCKPLVELLLRELLSGPLIRVDETVFQVLFEEGRSASSKSYMWVFFGGSRAGPVCFHKYDASRSGKVAAEVLSGYKGCVQSDGYKGYNFLDSWEGVVHAGCWAHARRKFSEVVKVAGKKKSNGKADKALRLIGKLYQIEREAVEQELSQEQLYEKRQKESKPVVEAFELFIRENVGRVLPKSLLGNAVVYSFNQMSRLKVFLDNGVIPLDNNVVENAIRPFALGRKNWLFSYHAEGAEASAFYYSLIETAKANGFEPYQYMRYLFENLPFAESDEDYRKLLPQYIDESQLSKTKKSS